MGPAIAGFICFLVDSVFLLLWLAIIVSAVMSWLFAFDVINYRNRFVAQLAHFLDSITAPILAPLRSVIPSLGGIDITPIIALLIISGIRSYILPASCTALYQLLSGF